MTTVPDLRMIPTVSLAQSEPPEKFARLLFSTQSGEPVGVSPRTAVIQQRPRADARRLA